MKAYERVIQETSMPQAPWFVIPADNKWFMQTVVGDIILDTLKKMDLKFPEPNAEAMQLLTEAKNILLRKN